LEKRGQGRFLQQYVFSTIDSLVTLALSASEVKKEDLEKRPGNQDNVSK